MAGVLRDDTELFRHFSDNPAFKRWLAVSGSGVVIPPGTTVLVTQVQGTTLVVLPLDGLDRPGTSRSGADGRAS